MSRFFIDRPIFAWVIALVIMLAGALAIKTLPIAQYPSIAAPQITISATYPGASAKTVENSVTQIIEQSMQGLDHLRYISSTSDDTGSASINLTFDAGTNPDIAQVQIQNKLQAANSLLPTAVQEQGVTINKSARNYLMVIGFISEDGSMDNNDLNDYVASNLQEQLSRVSGVGDIRLFGAQYAMRVWLDPNKLTSHSLTPSDVTTAITNQNVDVSAGQLAGLPAKKGEQLNATLIARSRLQTPEQFGNILLKVNTDGSRVLLKDVARIELGGESYRASAQFNGKPAAGLAIRLAAGANALDTATAVKNRVNELATYFPKGMKVVYPYDTTPFVKISIKEVVKTLVEAIALVFVVMYVFLQNFRATLIPTIAVPVVLLGTFAVMSATGFSINTLTMFGMVLAIGMLVDDAIVVVENVERVMSEEGLSPRDATRKSMGQITGALIGIALVLAAVFVPMAFFGGSTGVIYRQFSITVVSAMVLSVLVALIFTPALCATLLKPVAKGHGHGHEYTGFFGWFNKAFDNGSSRYQAIVGSMLKRTTRYMVVYGVIVVGMVFLFIRLPGSFLPDEDQGVLFSQVQLPAGATAQATDAVLDKVRTQFLHDKAVASIFTVSGFSFGGSGQNMGLGFVQLKDWEERNSDDLRVKAVVGRAMAAFAKIREASVFAFAPPAVMELGNATGFDLELKDQGSVGHAALMAARNQLLGMAAQNPNVVAVRPNGLNDSPQYHLDIDYEKASALGLAISDVNSTISTAWGSTYVNEFLDRGRIKKVYVQADAPFRMKPDDLNKWYVKNTSGSMVPLTSFVGSHWEYGSPLLERYNGQSAVEILGQATPGKSSGEAMAAMEQMIKQLPHGIGYEWTGLSYEERLSGSQAPALYAISLLVVFLSLAALYESWSIPFSVMMVVPLGVVGALIAAYMRGLSNDVYFQVGLLTTIGLSAKNAILIVEFAKEQQEHGHSLIEATMLAVRMRLRPILMTSLAFILGLLPLVINKGAGSGSQNALGTGVVGGMVSATVLAIFLVPVFFVVIRRLFPAKPVTPLTSNHYTKEGR